MDILDVLANATNTIAEGEVLQLMHCNNPDLAETDYLEVIFRKTAKLFEAGAECAAIIAGQDGAGRQALVDYGRHLGLAFQLVDDALDYNASAEELGKNIGDDLSEGKSTLPLIYAMDKGSAAERHMIREAIETGGTRNLTSIHLAIQATGGTALHGGARTGRGEVRDTVAGADAEDSIQGRPHPRWRVLPSTGAFEGFRNPPRDRAIIPDPPRPLRRPHGGGAHAHDRARIRPGLRGTEGALRTDPGCRPARTLRRERAALALHRRNEARNQAQHRRILRRRAAPTGQTQDEIPHARLPGDRHGARRHRGGLRLPLGAGVPGAARRRLAAQRHVQGERRTHPAAERGRLHHVGAPGRGGAWLQTCGGSPPSASRRRKRP